LRRFEFGGGGGIGVVDGREFGDDQHRGPIRVGVSGEVRPGQRRQTISATLIGGGGNVGVRVTVGHGPLDRRQQPAAVINRERPPEQQLVAVFPRPQVPGGARSTMISRNWPVAAGELAGQHRRRQPLSLNRPRRVTFGVGELGHRAGLVGAQPPRRRRLSQTG